jgi:hypothetical protein
LGGGAVANDGHAIATHRGMLHSKAVASFISDSLGKVLSRLGGGETLPHEISAFFHKKLRRSSLSMQTDGVFPITP